MKNILGNDLISVIIPVYNVEQYLEKCINSVLNQTYRNLEIILVDDGSKDSSGDICDKYAKMDSRVSVIHKENGGLSSARNAALDICKGDYILFVDSDDWIRLQMTEVMLAAIKENNADIAICGVGSDTAGKLKNNDIISEHIILTNHELMKEYVTTANVRPTVWNKLYKKKLFDNIRFRIGITHEDSYIMHEVLGKCEKAVYVKQTLYYQFVRIGSITQSGVTKKDFTLFEVSDRLNEYYGKHYPDLVQCTVAKKANDCTVLMARIFIDFDYRHKKDLYRELKNILMKEYEKAAPYVNNLTKLAVNHPLLFRLRNYYYGIRHKIGIIVRSIRG